MLSKEGKKAHPSHKHSQLNSNGTTRANNANKQTEMKIYLFLFLAKNYFICN